MKTKKRDEIGNGEKANKEVGKKFEIEKIKNSLNLRRILEIVSRVTFTSTTLRQR